MRLNLKNIINILRRFDDSSFLQDESQLMVMFLEFQFMNVYMSKRIKFLRWRMTILKNIGRILIMTEEKNSLARIFFDLHNVNTIYNSRTRLLKIFEILFRCC
eukprot:UN02239